MNNKRSLLFIAACILLSFIALVPLSFSRAQKTPPIITSIQSDLKLHKLTEEEVIALIPLHEGSRYSEQLVDQAEETLRHTGLFEKVEIGITQLKKEVSVRIVLVEARTIRKLSVSGNYPFLSRKILRFSSLQPGEPYRPEIISQDEKRVAAFFEKEGYYGTKVTIVSSFDDKNYLANLKIKIKKGKTYRLGYVTFNGNTFFNNSYLKNKLFSFTHFRLRKLKKQLKKIEKIYIEKGFVRARVRLTSTEVNHEKRQVDVVVNIKERKRLRLKFVGNRWFSPQTLDDYVTFYQERGYDRFEIERSKKKLINFYHLNGFINVSVETDVDKSKEDEIRIIMNIHEGPRARLKKAIFKGNKTFSKGKLSKIMINKRHTLGRQGFFRQEVVEEDLERIITYYQKNGFFDAQIIDREIIPNKFSDQITLKINLDEGKPYTVETIHFEGNELFETSYLFKKIGLKVGKRYSRKKLKKAEDKIQSMYQEKGYAYMKITSTPELYPETNSTTLTVQIEEGPQTHIGKIVVTGQYYTREKVIRNALKFKKGDLYTYKKILTGQLNLKRLGIFDHVLITPIGVEEENEIVDILVKVTERKSITFDLQAGFDSDKLGSGQITVTKRNIFGLAKQFQFRAIGGFEFDRGEITLYSPRFFGASWNLVNQYFIEYEDDENFNAFSYGGSLGTLKNFGPDWTLLLKTQISHFEIFESQSNQRALKKNLFDNTFAEFSASAVYDRRDNFADPEKGLYFLVSTEFDTDLSNAANNFNISNFNSAYYISFLKRFTLVNTLRLGKLFRISGSPRIPATKLFFMGGNDTVRGFDEDAINSSGGTTSIIYNAELQYRVFGDFKIAGFFDAGSLTERFSDISRNTIRRSAGVGVRYFTPVGPIRLDYGFVLDKKPGEKGQRFHFSFGHFF